MQRFDILADVSAIITQTDEFGAPQWSKNSGPVTMTEGTGNGQANKFCHKKSTLADGASETWDIRGGLPADDPFGNAVSFTTVKALIFRAASTNTTNLTFGNGTLAFVGPFGAATHTLQLQPGGAIVLFAPNTGWSVGAEATDDVKVANAAGASATYTMTIIGL